MVVWCFACKNVLHIWPWESLVCYGKFAEQFLQNAERLQLSAWCHAGRFCLLPQQDEVGIKRSFVVS